MKKKEIELKNFEDEYMIKVKGGKYKPSYVISFSFFEGENLNFAYSMEKNEARRVLRRIESFLEKEKIYS